MGVALVTGGARRVGRAIVQRLAAEGFDIAFTYLSSRVDAAALEQQVRDLGRQALAVQADLTDPAEACPAIHDAVRQHFGRLDVLVNSASAYEPGDLRHTDLALMRRMWAIHIEAPLLLCQSFEPMLRASQGRVINMVDLLAERPWPQYLAYCASKAGLSNLTQGLARALAPEVTVNGIAPGMVAWPEDFPVSQRENYLKRVPLQRAGTPDDVAGLVVFLVKEGGYLTGQIIRLDGGRSIT